MKSSVIIGAAGFIGYHLTKVLSERGYCIYAVVRRESKHNKRIQELKNVKVIEWNAISVTDLSVFIPDNCDFFFNLAWKPGGRYDFQAQMENAAFTLRMVELASTLGCNRFIGVGSQAEYGSIDELITEDIRPEPFCAYGISKLAACYLSKQLAAEHGMEWVWGRIFSVYGEYEPYERLIPQLIDRLRRGEEITLSSCRQNWDFLYGADAGTALLAIAEKGRNGEIYNIADGRYRPLKEFVEIVKDVCGGSSSIIYGEDPQPYVSLQPSVRKVSEDTGWHPGTDFRSKIRELSEIV